ncbi:MAG TPA: 16S rRNA (cytosine(967)-C(5))-methyltransferase RsmB [Pseudomonadales bacterium]|nr:16S rRNA (cytosine(967)-C(5))-methyltransferase RsmB [Pseudomonadales bacterium]
MSSNKNSRNVRACAAQVIADVVQHGRSLAEVLPKAQQKSSAADHALLAELCYGSLRFFYELDAIASLLLQKSFKDKDADVHALLLTGFYQLRCMRVPEHAAVNLTVEACRALKKDWAGSLLNGVMRNYLRNSESLNKKIALQPVARSNHPQWLEKIIRQAWPGQADDIFVANNARGGMSLRVNVQHQSVEEYQQSLQARGIESETSPIASQALLLQQAVNVNQLPGFSAGSCSVQDVAAQLCAPLLQLQKGQHVLDACCAPGGKTGHILETESQLAELVAIDNEESRLVRVRENLARLGLVAKVICADASKVDSWHDGKLFDRILLDAPCSGTGVIRRHPDIKHLRRESDIAALAVRQRELLEALWSLLTPGGILLYTTCSILPQENEQVVSAFIAQHTDGAVKKIEADWGVETASGRQLLPAIDHDGFFFARLIKQDSGL